ncbi:acetyltransferase, GNAT family [Lysobacter capsici AZ78]|uniref:Acetyltransferase, GNAT family n=1 Tax=Lysobacter capsici AZ78 TaxID=1444315 RepID=A0A108UD93_9GAMM|nr:GNAT family N-acetyltransferase [Lysobacter capsici]KWS06765.1 acetyltransferase, GNAT family [Lysobacter capsici AZ78]
MTSETPQFLIRRAVVADAATVADIAARTFVETFGDMYPPEDLAFFLKDSYSVEKQAVILSHPDYAIFLLERDGVVVGHAAAGPCGLPHPQVAPGDGELKRLYVLREAQNGGWGARLFDTVLAWLERDGPRTLWIGVWSENFGAQRFYGRYGFEKAGEYEFVVGGTRDHEFILRRNAAR